MRSLGWLWVEWEDLQSSKGSIFWGWSGTWTNLNPKKRIGRLFLGEQERNSFCEWKSGDLFFEMGNHCWLRGKVSFKTAGPKKIAVVVPKNVNTQEIQKQCKWNMKCISSQLPVNLSSCHRDEGHTVKARLIAWVVTSQNPVSFCCALPEGSSYSKLNTRRFSSRN